MRSEFEAVKNDIKGGIIPATVTPWTPDHELARDDLRQHVEEMYAVDGVVGVICNAKAGRNKMISRETKQEIIEIHRDLAGDKYVFAGVGGNSTAKQVAQAREAEEAGADAIMPIPMGIYQNGDPDEVIGNYEALAEAVDIPLFNFQPPTSRTPKIPMSAHIEICSMDEVVAFKEASWNPVRFERTVRELDHISDEFTMITGNDRFLYHSYLLGAETGLIMYGNIKPDWHVEKIRAVHDRDLEGAMEVRKRMLPLTNYLFREPEGKGTARMNAALEMMGIFEHADVIPPLKPLGTEERDELRRILKETGVVKPATEA